MRAVTPRLRALLGIVGMISALSAASATEASPSSDGAATAPFIAGRQNADGGWGLAAGAAGEAAVAQALPLQVETWDETLGIPRHWQGAYRTLEVRADGAIGRGTIHAGTGVAFDFADEWSTGTGALRLRRTVTVRGAAGGGFRSTATFRVARPQAWPDVEWFVPGMIYGNFDHLRDRSIGGRLYYQPGAFSVWIREDRMPAPLLAVRCRDGSTVAVLNPAPNGATTGREGNSFDLEPMVDPAFGFGSIGAEERDGTLVLGFGLPGSEGELSYGRKTAQGPETDHQWRRRYHPIKDGFVQHYEVAFQFGQAADLNHLVRATWRWAWENLNPQVNPQDLEAVRRSVVDAVAENMIEVADRAGVQIVHLAVPGGKEPVEPRAIMGFVGYALGSAESMLLEAQRDPSPRGRELRRLAEKSIASFLRLSMNPPVGEGFYLKTGKVAISQVVKTNPQIYLRCFTDDMKSLLRAYEAEKAQGRDHPEWLAWVRQFGDWLLTQEQPGGGYPRSWQPATGVVVSASTTGSFNVVPFYARLHKLTGAPAYLDAAVRAAEFGWNHGQARGRYVGGTIDNPDVIDKEAATIALEGYLDLYDATKDARWLERARAAGDIAETWVYIWNVPMPADVDDATLHWKRGVSTVGLQLIATGHSLVDAYMVFDVGSYARLARLTDDPHYLAVARILLHNPKAMIALPGRKLGLRGPGWQQEHYCLSLPRGVGRHQYWLPWVAVSQLRGINDLIAFDPTLYARLAAPDPKPAAGGQ